MHIIFKKRILPFIIPLFLLSGCGSFLLIGNFVREDPTSLQVHLVNIVPENHYAPTFQRTLTDSQAIQQLYNTMQVLPYQDAGSIARCCKVDAGLEYQLVFFQGQRVFLKVIYHP